MSNERVVTVGEPEKIDLKEYMREKFGEVNDRLDGIDTRLESLETDRDQRDGRNTFIVKAAKTAGGVIAAILAALGIKSQVGL